jgi:hypothetical protein
VATAATTKNAASTSAPTTAAAAEATYPLRLQVSINNLPAAAAAADTVAALYVRAHKGEPYRM